MDAWLAGYEHDTREADAGAGLNVLAGADKVVLHTTESSRGSYDAVRALWRGSQNWGRGLPHFIQDGTRFVQLLPLTVNAYTLANPPGPPDTNRAGHVIQVERCGYAAQPMGGDEYDACGRWLADLVRAGLGIDLAQHPKFYGAGDGIVLATSSSPIRLSAGAYDAFNGYLGHQHVPQNDHWDPGGIDGPRLETIARNYLGQTPPTPPEDDVKPEDIKAIAAATAALLNEQNSFVAHSTSGAIFRVGGYGPGKVHLLTPDQVDVVVQSGVPDRGTIDQRILDSFATQLDDVAAVGAAVLTLDDAGLAAIAKAVNDEQAKRLAN